MTCCCMACCYSFAPDVAAAAGTTRGCDQTESAATSEPCSADCDPYDPPSEAAAFVASATAAAFVLLAALLAVVLSSAAILTVFSMVPAAAAAASVDVRGHQQQQQQQHRLHFLQQEDHRHRPQRLRYDDAPRRKRQLFKDREPGIISLTFSLIGGTVADVKQAYRNVSGIVQETLAESVRQPTTTSEAAPAAADGDPMTVAAGNTAENEIGGSAAASTTTTTTTTAAPPVDQKLINRELRKLLGRNYRGLRRLFDSELRSAIKSSRSNVRDFTLELVGAIGQSLRPSRLFTRGPVDGDNTTAASE